MNPYSIELRERAHAESAADRMPWAAPAQPLPFAVRTPRANGARPPDGLGGAWWAHWGKTALTPRQSEVLNLMTEGMANKQIARKLNIALGTVKVHVASILRALSVSSRTQAVAKALRSGEPAAGRTRPPAG